MATTPATVISDKQEMEATKKMNEAAMRGQSVPPVSALASEMTRLCLIHGIRNNDGFATELQGFLEFPAITRALNARAIMSNRIPDMATEEEMPYCFWHPDLPSEETLRALLSRYRDRYPSIRYQVGRACAAAGYTGLYRGLHADILPDVAIAEEALDNEVSGQAIYDLVMQQPTRYAMMDDYSRRILDEDGSKANPSAGLNGDTCVCSALDKPQPAGDLVDADTVATLPFDITEDRNISLTGILPTQRPVSPETIRLLFTPLPRDLPTVDKDLLILVSAWAGDIDRYSRLRRPRPLPGEMQCVIRGIYHNTFFAKWWSTLPHTEHERLLGQPGLTLLEHIHARFVVNNDLSWLTDSTPESALPKLIWYPNMALLPTYEELVRRRPSMKHACVKALIFNNNPAAFTLFGEVVPTEDLHMAAMGRDFHSKWLEKRAEELGISFLTPRPAHLSEEEMVEGWRRERWPMIMVDEGEWIRNVKTSSLRREITTGDLGFDNDTAADPGWKRPRTGAPNNIDLVELHVSALANLDQLVPEGYKGRELMAAYRDWMWVEEEHIPRLGLYPDPRCPSPGGYRRRGRGRGGRVL